MTISKTAARRFALGRQGLWPGRRWVGKDGAAAALLAIEAVQMDPLNVVARSHDIALWGRVLDYRPEHLDHLLYRERAFFDYGGVLFVYPMSELPFWRLHMRRQADEPRWASFAATHQPLLDEVRAELRRRGPLGNREFTGQSRVTSYRGRKDSALALYYLWLTGEAMIDHRRGFERVYHLRERVAPPAVGHVAPGGEAEQFFARKAVAFAGTVRERDWRTAVSGLIHLAVSRDEARAWLATLTQQDVLTPITVGGSPDRWYVLSDNRPLLAALEAGHIPDVWRPHSVTTEDEVVLLAPLDIVSARGRAAWLFDFEYIWEVYKPAAARRWGYYTLPILYGDRLVARIDPKLDRTTATLRINSFWLEDHAPAADPAFAAALARGLLRFTAFLNAGRIDLSVVEPAALWRQVSAIAGTLSSVPIDAAQ